MTDPREIDCPLCGGSGRMATVTHDLEADTWESEEEPCGLCHGTGRIIDTRCPCCGQPYNAATAAEAFIAGLDVEGGDV